MSRLSSSVFFFLTLLIVFFTVFGNHGLLHLRSLNNEESSLVEKNKQIEAEIFELRNEIYALENSDFVLEKRAREDLGYTRKGEVVYYFPKKTKNKFKKCQQIIL